MKTKPLIGVILLAIFGYLLALMIADEMLILTNKQKLQEPGIKVLQPCEN